jgi:L-serine deaminase
LLSVPIAVNWAVSPGKIDATAGEITIETRGAETTVIEPYPATPDSVAVMLADPVAPLVARPELDILAMPVLDEVQSADLVMSLVDPLL